MANPVRWPPASPQMYFQDEDGLHHANPFLRVKGRDKSAFAALGQGIRNRVGERVVDRRPARPTEDYTQVDLTLTVTIPMRQVSIPAPQVGVSYAGMTPAQRHWFLFWLCSPDQSGTSRLSHPLRGLSGDRPLRDRGECKTGPTRNCPLAGLPRLARPHGIATGLAPGRVAG